MVIISHRLKIKDTLKLNNVIYLDSSIQNYFTWQNFSTLMNIITKIVSISYNYTINKNNNKILLEMQFFGNHNVADCNIFPKIQLWTVDHTDSVTFILFYDSRWKLKLSIIRLMIAQRTNSRLLFKINITFSWMVLTKITNMNLVVVIQTCFIWHFTIVYAHILD